MYAIDVKPVPPPLKNNRSAHLNYINHLKESVEIVREIVEEARVAKPLDNALNYACQYTKLSQELLEYVIGTCPKSFNERDYKAPSTPVTRKKQVTFNDKPGTSSSNTQKHESVLKGRPLVYGLRLFKTYDGESSTMLMIFVEKFSADRSDSGMFHFGAIMGYGDYVIGDSVISVGQFCDSNLEIAFRKHSCFIRDMNGVDLLKGSHSTNLYTISLDDIMKSSPVYLLSKASKTKSWLWHCRLNHLYFGTINDLSRKDLFRGLPRLKFEDYRL
ncbi:retrovirus-related pol polyprotein from transposon TNT 1-94 [Tanacetum coccineum]|uniref:Retrovirus-related pol polyprotein from transposon TNT 1-94 n=1 Tax=Tanacetum coccineum TaxID=301880 RepID=A0ABQ4WQT9_9ASTR